MLIFEAPGLTFGANWGRGGGGCSHGRVSVFKEEYFLSWRFIAWPKSTSKRLLLVSLLEHKTKTLSKLRIVHSVLEKTKGHNHKLDFKQSEPKTCFHRWKPKRY